MSFEPLPDQNPKCLVLRIIGIKLQLLCVVRIEIGKDGRNGMHAGRNGMNVGCTRCCFGTYEADADVDPNHRPGIDPPFRCLDIDECAKGTHHCDIHATCTNLEGGKKDVAGFACQCNEGKRSQHICGFINIYKPLR